MKRQRIALSIEDPQILKNRLLRTCGRVQQAMFLDSNDHHDPYGKYEWLAGIEALYKLSVNENSLSALTDFQTKHQDWLFGHLSYDLKNELEDLSSSQPDRTGFAHLEFFVPRYLIFKDETGIWLESHEELNESDFLNFLLPAFKDEELPDQEIHLTAQTSKEEYLNTVASLRQELQFGNIYEINYCIEFADEQKLTDPTAAFLELDLHTEAPFAGYYRTGNNHLLCASPERYLRKKGQKLISQPMKGTARRDIDPERDAALKSQLAGDEKERSENVMITDLVRNDLSMVAEKGSVKVEELFGVYTFRSVHQMISTVSCRVSPDKNTGEFLKASFPMGSMTGAPKVSAMKLIEQHEKFSRGIYAGSIGYLSPDGDFDFNVVIRSILYNDEVPYLSARVGSAITIHCDAEKEYEECLLKAESLLRALRKDRMSAS